MKNFSKKQCLKRMSYICGHLNGNKKMLQEDRYCIDIIRQNEAVIAAIKTINRMILANHFNTCVIEALKGKDSKNKKKKIKELLEIFKNSER